MTGPVTALGIRDGDPDVLRALIARRGSAVLAYCERACPAAQVADAAAEAFARFRALVVAAPRPADLDPEAALLSSTRHAAAERAPRGQAPPSGAGLGRLLGGRPTADQITLVPELLIARADGTLTAEGDEQLNRLLDASAAARAAEERFRTAEHAYRSAPPRPIPDEIVDHIIAAMTTVPAPPREAAVQEPLAADRERDLVTASAAGAPSEAVSADAPPPPPPEVPADEPAEEPDTAAAAATDAAPEPLAEEPAAPAPPDDARPEEDREEDAPPDDTPSPVADEEQGIDEEDDMADAGTEEWRVPPDELGQEGSLDEDEASRIQTASGAVDEPLAEDEDEDEEEEEEEDDEPVPAPVPPRAGRPAPPARARGAVSASRAQAGRAGAPPSRGVPGKGALAPAAAVVAVAAVSILATSGVLGGDESQPPVDTGIAPKRSQVEVPEGEASAVIDDLRRSADAARRRRLADKRGSAAPAPAPEEETREEAPAPAPEPAPEEEQPQEQAPAEPEAGAQDEQAAPEDTGGDAADGNTGEPRDAATGEAAP